MINKATSYNFLQPSETREYLVAEFYTGDCAVGSGVVADSAVRGWALIWPEEP